MGGLAGVGPPPPERLADGGPGRRARLLPRRGLRRGHRRPRRPPLPRPHRRRRSQPPLASRSERGKPARRVAPSNWPQWFLWVPEASCRLSRSFDKEGFPFDCRGGPGSPPFHFSSPQNKASFLSWGWGKGATSWCGLRALLAICEADRALCRRRRRLSMPQRPRLIVGLGRIGDGEGLTGAMRRYIFTSRASSHILCPPPWRIAGPPNLIVPFPSRHTATGGCSSHSSPLPPSPSPRSPSFP